MPRTLPTLKGQGRGCVFSFFLQVGDSSIFVYYSNKHKIFGLVRGSGAFAAVLPTLVLVSRFQLAQRYRGFGHFLSAVSSSRLEAMVGGSWRGLRLYVSAWVSVVDIWVGTWDRVFRYGASDFGFGFKISARGTLPWLRSLPQRSVFFTT
jgi:hypothetical protein